MTAIKYRIPRMAAAVMVLGTGCGGDGDRADGGSVDGGKVGIDGGGAAADVNVSVARAEEINTEYCRLYAECDPEGFAMHYDNADDCVAQYVDGWEEYVDAYGADCADAVLDELECTNELGCEVDTAPCAERSAKVDELCDFGSTSSTTVVRSSGSSSSKARTLAKRRLRRRIPR